MAGSGRMGVLAEKGAYRRDVPQQGRGRRVIRDHVAGGRANLFMIIRSPRRGISASRSGRGLKDPCLMNLLTSGVTTPGRLQICQNFRKISKTYRANGRLLRNHGM